MSRSKKIVRNLVDQANNLPIPLNPEIVTAIGLLMFFNALGVKKGFVTVLLAHIMFCISLCDTVCYAEAALPCHKPCGCSHGLGRNALSGTDKVLVPQICRVLSPADLGCLYHEL
ncbi:MAG: hypothetical protein V8Q32_04955 [Anaerotignum faecicola]